MPSFGYDARALGQDMRTVVRQEVWLNSQNKMPNAQASVQAGTTLALLRIDSALNAFSTTLSKIPRSTLVKKWQCLVCGFIYDEELGLPEDGIAPGTRWDEIPDDWMCPECGVGKEDFEMVEI